jgi:hypothetical protein
MSKTERSEWISKIRELSFEEDCAEFDFTRKTPKQIYDIAFEAGVVVAERRARRTPETPTTEQVALTKTLLDFEKIEHKIHGKKPFNQDLVKTAIWQAVMEGTAFCGWTDRAREVLVESVQDSVLWALNQNKNS